MSAPGHMARWSELPDLAGVAALLRRAPDEVAAEHASLPDGIEGLALLEAGEVVALALWVETELPRTGRCSLVRLSAREPERALELVDAAEARAVRQGARSLVVGEKHVPGAAALLAARGYARSNAMVTMRRTRRRPEPPLPPGLAERSLDEVGPDAWAGIENAAFEGMPFAVRVTRADAERQRASPSFDASLLRFLVDPDGVMGMLRGVVSGDRKGEVESIGLAARARGRGLGRWLLRRCEALLDRRHVREVVLRVVESNTPAVTLYRAEGYVEASRDVAWERVLP